MAEAIVPLYPEFTVLIVDWDSKRANNVNYVLEGLYYTKIAESVEEALELIKTKNIDLIISVYEFPNGMNGLDLCKKLSENDDDEIFVPEVMIVLEKDDSILKSRLLDSGAFDVVLRPYNMLDLYAKIETNLDRIQEKKKLFNSIQKLKELQKVKSKKNLEFQTKLIAKQRDLISSYEMKIKKIKDELDDVKAELKKAYKKIDILEAENRELKKKVEDIEQEEVVDEETLKELAKYLYHDANEEENFVQGLVEDIVKFDFDFKRIDNFFFISNVSNVIRKHVARKVDEAVEENKDDKKVELLQKHKDNLVEYITRRDFHKFMFYLTIKLLEEVATKNENALKFLKFYDGRIEIAPNGERFQKPIIRDADGEAINLVSIMQIINQRAIGKKNLDQHRKAIRNVKHELNKLSQQLEFLFREESIEFDKNSSFLENARRLEDYLRQKKSNTSKFEVGTIEEIDMKLERIEVLKTLHEKEENLRRSLEMKYQKQVEFYRPIEEKFSKIALAVSQTLLKIKSVQ